MRNFSYGISVLFHPLFMSAYFLLFLYMLNPVFIDIADKTATLFIIQLLAATIVFPMVAIFMMKGLGFIDSVEMKDHKERVGPLLTTSIFYIWMYLNFKRSSYVPDYITYFLLGCTVSLFVSFFITLFYKISLHAVAIAGLICGLYIVKTKYFFYEFILPLIGKTYVINADILILVLLLVCGLIGTCRIFLKEHTTTQIYTGYAVGSLSMAIAFVAYF
jgi:hypothetical protein